MKKPTIEKTRLFNLQLKTVDKIMIVLVIVMTLAHSFVENNYCMAEQSHIHHYLHQDKFISCYYADYPFFIHRFLHFTTLAIILILSFRMIKQLVIQFISLFRIEKGK